MARHKPRPKNVDIRTYLIDTAIVDPVSGCWNWPSDRAGDRTGYGRILYNGKNYPVHKLSYLLFKGEIPVGLVTRHLCHNRRCINIKHLDIGTQKQNIQDSIDYFRELFGKLTAADVIAIRELFKTDITLTQIAKNYNVSVTSICSIKNGRTWKQEDR